MVADDVPNDEETTGLDAAARMRAIRLAVFGDVADRIAESEDGRAVPFVPSESPAIDDTTGPTREGEPSAEAESGPQSDDGVRESSDPVHEPISAALQISLANEARHLENTVAALQGHIEAQDKRIELLEQLPGLQSARITELERLVGAQAARIAELETEAEQRAKIDRPVGDGLPVELRERRLRARPEPSEGGFEVEK